MRLSFAFLHPRAALTALLPLCMLLSGCRDRNGVRAQLAVPCELPEHVAELPKAIVEASGIVVSRADPTLLWVHNDSDPHLYALARDGSQRGRVRLREPIDDWEDLALAECAAGHCLYVADIGDNQHEREFVTIYRIPEPSPGDTRAPAADRMDLRYPDGPRDAEALFVLPGERIHIVSKGRKGAIALYRINAFQPGTVATLEQVRAFTPGVVQFPDMVTGAELSPDARWLAIRTYSYVDLYALADDTLATRATARVPITALREPQGEGVALTADGELLLVSERQGGRAPFSRVRCTLR